MLASNRYSTSYQHLVDQYCIVSTRRARTRASPCARSSKPSLCSSAASTASGAIGARHRTSPYRTFCCVVIFVPQASHSATTCMSDFWVNAAAESSIAINNGKEDKAPSTNAALERASAHNQKVRRRRKDSSGVRTGQYYETEINAASGSASSDQAFADAKVELLQRELVKVKENLEKLSKEMARHAIQSEMKVDSAMDTALRVEESVRAQGLAASIEKAAEDEDAIVPQTIDQTDLANIFSFSLERALTISELNFFQRLREVLASTVLLLLQTLYCFGLQEYAKIEQLQSQLRPYAEPLPPSFFYLHSLIEGYDGVTPVPRIHFAAGCCSLVLLAMCAKNHNEGGLLTVCPLDVLFFPRSYGLNDPEDKPQEGVFPRLILGLAWLRHVLVVLYMQLLWTVRMALLPVLAMLGSSAAFAASASTHDVILNSVIIAFVFSLDGFLYNAVSATADIVYRLAELFSNGKASSALHTIADFLCVSISAVFS